MAVSTGKKGRRFKITDFLMRWGRSERRRQTPEQMAAILNRLSKKD